MKKMGSHQSGTPDMNHYSIYLHGGTPPWHVHADGHVLDPDGNLYFSADGRAVAVFTKGSWSHFILNKKEA